MGCKVGEIVMPRNGFLVCMLENNVNNVRYGWNVKCTNESSCLGDLRVERGAMATEQSKKVMIP